MGEEKLTGEALCRAFMRHIHYMIDSNCRTMTRYLRHGVRSPGEEYFARHILKLVPAQLTSEQIDALEETLRQVQEDLMDAFFCVIEGSAQPEGFPDEIRLLNMDTGEEICPGPDGLTWAFAGAGREWRARVQDEGTAGPAIT
jgi:hypothetical protein